MRTPNRCMTHPLFGEGEGHYVHTLTSAPSSESSLSFSRQSDFGHFGVLRRRDKTSFKVKIKFQL